MNDKSSEAVLDPAVIDRLRQLGREVGRDDFLAQMAETFLESLPSLQDLEAKINEQDGDAVYAMAHSLKGNSASFGALRLAALAGELEDEADAGLDEPWPRWQEFASEFVAVGAALRTIS